MSNLAEPGPAVKRILAVVAVTVLLSSLSAGFSTDSRIRIDIDHEYSSIIVEPGSIRDVHFTVKNRMDEQVQVSTSFEGVETYFADGAGSKTYTLDPKESKSFTARIEPGENTGREDLIVKTENLASGLESAVEVPVYVREYPSVASRNQVPGIGMVNLVFILAFSSLLYYLRL